MNYRNIYESLIKKALQQNRIKVPHDGYDRHHIIPKSLGGDESSSNLVLLTGREHYLAHKLLVKMYQGNDRKKMIYALWWMSKTKSCENHSNKCRITSRDYEYARNLFVESNINNDPLRKEKFRKNHQNGVYKYDYEKLADTIRNNLKQLSSEEMKIRMLKSTMTADPIARANAIRRGKASILEITNIDGTSEIIYSDQVKNILGIDWQRVKYRIDAHKGLLEDGRKVIILKKYIGGNRWKKNS